MSSAPQLTARDVNLLAIAFQSLKDDCALQIDYAKLAQLAGYKTAASANACFLTLKKKLMAGASVSNAAAAPTPKKAKGKAAANGDADDDDEATPSKAAPKKRGKAIKTELADAEGGDADTEVTPGAESPKKGRAKKRTGPSKNDANGDTPTKATTNEDATNDTAATGITTPTPTPTPKRKRGPSKPKDPNATPTKRAKKNANAKVTTSADGAAADDNNDAANTQLHGVETVAQTNGEGSIFGGDANVKEEEQEGDDRCFDAEEQKMAEDELFNIYTTEGQAA